MSKSSQIEKIKNHFDEEALEFDSIILKLIPYYNEMVEALVSSISYDYDSKFNVIDLGCGTGTILKIIKERYPNAVLTAVDISEYMIELTKHKLSNAENITYYVDDFYNFDFTKEYNVVVSSLALHHLVNDDDKKMFYKKIYNSLSTGGIFINADVVLGTSNTIQKMYMSKWIQYMNKYVSMEEIEQKWIPTYKEEDRPTTMMNHIDWLKEIGFNDIDIVWKYYNFCVYSGMK